MRARLAFLSLLLCAALNGHAQVRGFYPAAPGGFASSFYPLTQWLRTPEGLAAIAADPPLRQMLRIDPLHPSGRAALAPLAGVIPAAAVAELATISTLDETRRAAALTALKEARTAAAPGVEKRVSETVAALHADPDAFDADELKAFEQEAGRLALYTTAGRVGAKSLRRMRVERAMRQAGRAVSGQRLDWDNDDFSPATPAADVSIPPVKIAGLLPPSAYYDPGHWNGDLVPDADYRRRLAAAAALFVAADKAATPGEIKAANARLALTDSMRGLDPKIYSHMMRVGLVAGMIAYQMGYSLDYVRRVEWGARIHDIGKREENIRLVVNKEGKLDPAERAVMERHADVGAAIISLDRSLDPLSRRVGVRVARGHHETADGKGYPRGLQGDQIPLEARITAVADFYDALMENRPYRPGMTNASALAVMAKSAHQFDPGAWKAFQALMAPAGL